MKKIILMLVMLLSWGTMRAQSGVAVLDKNGNAVGIFIRQTDKWIEAEMRYQWKKLNKSDGYTVKRLSADNGQGWLVPTCSGSLNIREQPHIKSKVVASWMIPADENQKPEIYSCLGVAGDWYKVRTKAGKVGFVRSDMVTWWQVDITRFDYSREYYTDKLRNYD